MTKDKRSSSNMQQDPYRFSVSAFRLEIWVTHVRTKIDGQTCRVKCVDRFLGIYFKTQKKSTFEPPTWHLDKRNDLNDAQQPAVEDGLSHHHRDDALIRQQKSNLLSH